ncbi:transposase [Solidesulfovibrio magneticus]|uniref:transposase n=1 Tax=Solidesulfovibrio magneticus TaxID=184917 RepID=UPI0009D6E731
MEKQEGLHPARRWVVERTFAWLKGFRGIRTRYCLYLSTFIAFVKLACAIIVFRKSYARQ